MESYIWGDAEVTYPDMVGTAQLDERMTIDESGNPPNIENVVGLDRDKWHVIGIEIGGGEHSHELRVLAVPDDLVPEGGNVFPKIAAANGGELPVTEFLVHDTDPYKVLRAITHMLDLRLRSASTRDIPIRVVELGDIPEQEKL